MKLTVIAAVAENGVIGRDDQLPWRLSADLRRFKRLTMGHPIIMGRRTWESIRRPLPGRTSIVVTGNQDYDPGFGEVRVAPGLDEALQTAADVEGPNGQAFVIGGGRLYEAAMAIADQLYLTRVEAHVDGDVRFPEFDQCDWRLVRSESHPADQRNQYPTEFQVYERR